MHASLVPWYRIFIDLAGARRKQHETLRKRRDLAEYLLQAGADCDARDDYQMTPLHFVCDHDSFADVAQYLIQAGADYNARCRDQDTSLDVAAAWTWHGACCGLGRTLKEL